MSVQYRPDPFFEAESVGPAITFGAGPLGQLEPPLPPPPGMAYDEHGSLISLDQPSPEEPTFPDNSFEVDLNPADAYGDNWDTKGVPMHADRKAYLEQWPNEATDEEAEVLNLPPNLWSNATRAKMGLPRLPTAPEKAQEAYLSKTRGGSRRNWLALAGVGIVLLGALALRGGGRRRRGR